MSKKQVGTRFRTEIAAAVEDYAEEKDISASEAVERSTERGLIEMGYLEQKNRTFLQNAGEEVGRGLLWVALITGVMSLAFMLPELIPFSVIAFTGAMLGLAIEYAEPAITIAWRKGAT